MEETFKRIEETFKGIGGRADLSDTNGGSSYFTLSTLFGFDFCGLKHDLDEESFV